MSPSHKTARAAGFLARIYEFAMDRLRDQCDRANLHHCSAHGLRKATAAALAEAGASAHEIAAVTGHMSLEEIERYTRAARKMKLADTAMAKLK
jgi:integrase/recombinase XerD